MSEPLRAFNAQGLEQFEEYLARVRNGSTEELPSHLLSDNGYCEVVSDEIQIAQQTFTDRYELGRYLAEVLAPLDRHQISRNHMLWNWLTLYYFDVINKREADGFRKLLRQEMYVLDPQYNYLRYYKHLVRTPWLAVLDHGENAKVLFITSRGTRSDIEETLAASQQVLGNATIIGAAYRLYFDSENGKPKPGASGKGAGSPRRLTGIIQQLALTYDIQSCPLEKFVEMLPAEFNRFKPSKMNSH